MWDVKPRMRGVNKVMQTMKILFRTMHSVFRIMKLLPT